MPLHPAFSWNERDVQGLPSSELAASLSAISMSSERKRSGFYFNVFVMLFDKMKRN